MFGSDSVENLFVFGMMPLPKSVIYQEESVIRLELMPSDVQCPTVEDSRALTFHPPPKRLVLILTILKFVIALDEEAVPQVVIDSIRFMGEYFRHVAEAAFKTWRLSVFDITNVDHELEIHQTLV